MKIEVKNANIKNSSGQLKITLRVINLTGGWTDVTLSAVEYTVPPSDGIQDYILKGTPSNSKLFIYDLESFIPNVLWFRGVRVWYENEVLLILRSVVIEDPKPLPTIPDITIKDGSFDGEKLDLKVEYIGGNIAHNFKLTWDGSYQKSLPAQIKVGLYHKDNGDKGKSLQSEVLHFDFSSVNLDSGVGIVCSEPIWLDSFLVCLSV